MKVTPVMVFGEEGPMVQAMRDINVETHVLPLAARCAISQGTLSFRALLGSESCLVAGYSARIADSPANQTRSSTPIRSRPMSMARSPRGWRGAARGLSAIS